MVRDLSKFAAPLQAVMNGLLDASDFVTIATTVCKLGRQHFGLHQCVVALYETTSSVKPVVMVDNCPGVNDEHRLLMCEPEAWVLDPMLRQLRLDHVPVGIDLITTPEFMRLAREHGYTGADVHTLLLPIVQPGGLIGSMRCGHLEPFTERLSRDLAVLSSHVAVRLAQLGVTGVPDPSLALLTPRQVDVAQLAARGRTNSEIGRVLQISDNTIKKHLKDVFDQLNISNRTELAALLAHVGPQHTFPVGVTHLGEISITTPA